MKSSCKDPFIGVVVPDKFYELARRNEEMYLFSPYSVELDTVYQFNYIDITEKYEAATKTHKAHRQLLLSRYGLTG